MNLPTCVPTPDLSAEINDVIRMTQTEAPPDLLTRLRRVLAYEIAPAACRVYINFLLASDAPPADNAVMAVFYYFDRGNRERVAALMGMTYNELMYLLAGYELGKEGPPMNTTIERIAPHPDLSGGVVAVLCACCGETWLIINRTAYDGELQFCRACLALPEPEAEALIAQTEKKLWQSEHYQKFQPL